MADIDLQKKQGPGPWPWLIGLLALALIVWGVWEWMDNDDDTFVAADTQEQVVPMEPVTPVPTDAGMTGSAEVQRFTSWVRDSANTAQEMGREHEYTRNGLERLSQAMESLIARDTAPAMQEHLQTIRQHRQAVQQSEPTSSEHASHVKQAFEASVEALDELSQQPRMQQAQLGTHVQSARSAIESINAETPLLEQREAVHQFFRSMAEALEVAGRYTAA